MTYRDFIAKSNKMELGMNRKVLSELAQVSPEQFTAIVDKVKKS